VRFGHTDRQITEAFGLIRADLLLGLLTEADISGAIDLGRNRMALVFDR